VGCGRVTDCGGEECELVVGVAVGGVQGKGTALLTYLFTSICMYVCNYLRS